MSDEATTPFLTRAGILAELWINYRNDEQFADFIEYNDIGLPLSYIIAENIVKPTEMAERFVDETFELFLAGLNLEDEGFDSLDDVLSAESPIEQL